LSILDRVHHPHHINPGFGFLGPRQITPDVADRTTATDTLKEAMATGCEDGWNKMPESIVVSDAASNRLLSVRPDM
jgi:hypothetical protein